jgi:hypothetical protein
LNNETNPSHGLLLLVFFICCYEFELFFSKIKKTKHIEFLMVNFACTLVVSTAGAIFARHKKHSKAKQANQPCTATVLLLTGFGMPTVANSSALRDASHFQDTVLIVSTDLPNIIQCASPNQPLLSTDR